MLLIQEDINSELKILIKENEELKQKLIIKKA